LGPPCIGKLGARELKGNLVPLLSVFIQFSDSVLRVELDEPEVEVWNGFIGVFVGGILLKAFVVTDVVFALAFELAVDDVSAVVLPGVDEVGEVEALAVGLEVDEEVKGGGPSSDFT